MAMLTQKKENSVYLVAKEREVETHEKWTVFMIENATLLLLSAFFVNTKIKNFNYNLTTNEKSTAEVVCAN
jgi:hypothetical protein